MRVDAALQTALEAEMTEAIGAAKEERTAARRTDQLGHSHGYRDP
jgi:transposase-like protein